METPLVTDPMHYTVAVLFFHLPGTFATREHDLDALWDAGASGLEERAGFIRAYFDARCELPDSLRDGEWAEEADQDWQAEFKKGLKPVQAGRVTIVPPWLTAEVPAEQQTLIIEPGMAFGTGHHATTRMAVEALSDLDLTGQSVLDVGTGSGVLAIAAVKLGARVALGVDIDPLTIPIARENAQLNGVAGPGLVFQEGSLGPEPLPVPGGQGSEYDVLVANLYAELHDLLAGDYLAQVRPGGHLILTGILVGKLELVLAALAREGVQDIRQRVDGEWVLLTAQTPR